MCSFVVWANDENMAARIAEDLYDHSDIDLSRNCYNGYDISVVGVADNTTNLYTYDSEEGGGVCDT